MAKVIGFNSTVALKSKAFRIRSNEQLVSNQIFAGACAKVAEINEIPIETYLTARQASKFRRGKGIVYKSIIS